jgi:hypothetical protein
MVPHAVELMAQMISRRSHSCQLPPRGGAPNRANILSAIYITAALGGCSFSERLPGLLDGGPTGSAELSKSDAGKREAHASVNARSELDAPVSQSKVESSRSGEFAADEGLEPLGELCGAATTSIAETSEETTPQAASCRRADNRVDFSDPID